MSFTVEYRPAKLSELQGQPRAKAILGPWLRKGTTPGAILITGAKGTGKTTIARIIARVTHCSKPTKGEPCGECRTCKMDIQSHADYIEFNSASDRGIDAVRRLQDNLKMRPTMGKKKIVLFDEAHGITSAAFQALLKVVEEPGSHVILIFATTNPEKLPETLIDRCSHISLRPTLAEDCFELLNRIAKDQKMDTLGVTEDHLKRIVASSRANNRSAIKALEQVYSMVEDAQDSNSSVETAVINNMIATVTVADVDTSAEQIVRGILSGNTGSAIKRADDHASEAEPLLSHILTCLKQAFLLASSPKQFNESFTEVMEGLPVFDLPNKRKVLLETCENFSELRIQTSNHMVPIHEVMYVTIAKSAFLVKDAIKAAKPKDEAPKEAKVEKAEKKVEKETPTEEAEEKPAPKVTKKVTARLP